MSRLRRSRRCWREERAAGLHTLAGHDGFAESVARVRDDILGFLLDCRREGKRVVAYGAPGKGNTLLNHCGIRADLVAVQRRPQSAQARQVPARHPHPDQAGGRARGGAPRLRARHAVEPARPRSPRSSSYVRDWGARLVVALPAFEIF